MSTTWLVSTLIPIDFTHGRVLGEVGLLVAGEGAGAVGQDDYAGSIVVEGVVDFGGVGRVAAGGAEDVVRGWGWGLRGRHLGRGLVLMDVSVFCVLFVCAVVDEGVRCWRWLGDKVGDDVGGGCVDKVEGRKKLKWPVRGEVWLPGEFLRRM